MPKKSNFEKENRGQGGHNAERQERAGKWKDAKVHGRPDQPGNPNENRQPIQGNYQQPVRRIPAAAPAGTARQQPGRSGLLPEITPGKAGKDAGKQAGARRCRQERLPPKVVHAGTTVRVRFDIPDPRVVVQRRAENIKP